MIRTVVWCGSRLRPYPQATRRTFSEARSQSLATLPRRWVGSEGSEIIAHATHKCSEASKNIAPATQKESRVTIVANDLHLPHKQNVYTRNFSEPSRILHLPHKKQVGSPVSPNLGSQSTSRRHWNYCAGHTKSLSITCDPSQQACIGSGEIISEASKLLHLPHKSHLTLPNKHV